MKWAIDLNERRRKSSSKIALLLEGASEHLRGNSLARGLSGGSWIPLASNEDALTFARIEMWGCVYVYCGKTRIRKKRSLASHVRQPAELLALDPGL
jgi:hypothetical protein